MQYVREIFKGVTIDLAIHSYWYYVCCTLYLRGFLLTFLAHLAKGHMSFCHHLASVVRRRPLYVVNFHI